MPPEQLWEEYRAAALWNAAAALLVDLAGEDEAIGLVAPRLDGASPPMKVAVHLLANGDPARVGKGLDLVEARRWEREGRVPPDDVQFLRGLEARYAAHGRHDKALETARRAFALSLDQESYDLVRMAAVRLPDDNERWPTLRSEMLATLRERRHWGTLPDSS